MNTVLRNRIPAILEERGLNISRLQLLAGLSYPATHNIATAEVLSDHVRVGTLRKVGTALGVPIGELIVIEAQSEGS